MKIRITDGSSLECDADIERVGGNVRVAIAASENPTLRFGFTLAADGAKGLADAILAVCEEIAALPPEGWVRPTTRPEPGALLLVDAARGIVVQVVDHARAVHSRDDERVARFVSVEHTDGARFSVEWAQCFVERA